MQLLLSFDLTNESEQDQFEKVLWMLGELPPTLPEQAPGQSDISRQLSLLLRTKAELHKIDENGELELLSMQWNSLSVPGGIATVLAVFKNGKFVDRIVREKSTRLENSHELSVTDLDRDGVPDIALDIENGCWGPGDKRVEYRIDDSGFSRIGKL